MAPFVDAELNRRFPGRAEWRAVDPNGLRAAWEEWEHHRFAVRDLDAIKARSGD